MEIWQPLTINKHSNIVYFIMYVCKVCFSMIMTNLTDNIASQPNSGNWEQVPPSPQPQSLSEPFKRNEPKRKSISSSFTAMFSRKMITGGKFHIKLMYTHPNSVENNLRFTHGLSSTPSCINACTAKPRWLPILFKHNFLYFGYLFMYLFLAPITCGGAVRRDCIAVHASRKCEEKFHCTYEKYSLLFH